MCSLLAVRFFATDAFGYWQPSSTSWYALSNGYAYSSVTPLAEEGWTSASSTGSCASGSTTTFSFICNTTATTTQSVSSSARIFADPTQCQYIVQLQTALACQSTSNYAASPASGFGGLGYDLGALTGYDMFSAESGNYNGQFSNVSFCITMYNGTNPTGWAYAARGTATVTFTAGSVTAPAGTVVMASLLSSVMSSSNGQADVQFTLSGDDGGNNLLTINPGSTAAYPNGGGVSIYWPRADAPNGQLFANMYMSGTSYAIDQYFGWWKPNANFSITAQYFDYRNPQQLISCPTSSAPQPVPSAFNPSALTVVPYWYTHHHTHCSLSSPLPPSTFAPRFSSLAPLPPVPPVRRYYINLAGQVRDPSCQQYAPGSMVCQHYVPNSCSTTEVVAVWSPSTSTPSWTYLNGVNYSSGIQLSLLSSPPLSNTHTGVSQVFCNGTMTRLQFVCQASALRPYVASSYKSVSANNACVFTFIIGTYLLCAAPGQTATVPISTVANCAPTVNGRQYNLAPLGVMDISAYDSANTQYVMRPCGVVQNGFGQGTVATYQSSLISIPVICSTANAAGVVNITSIAGVYAGAGANWTAMASGNGVQLTQASGQTCVATCGGAVVYNGPWVSVAQFVCATQASTPSASVSVGGYDGGCNAVNGGSCTLTFVTQTASACQAPVTSGAAVVAALTWMPLVSVLVAGVLSYLL